MGRFAGRGCPRLAPLVLALLLGMGVWRPVSGQTGWSPDPLYRYAGQYVGEWSSEALDLQPGQGGPPSFRVVGGQGGHLRGQLTVDVACDGAITIYARGQTDRGPSFATAGEAAGGPATAHGVLDVVAEASLEGWLESRRAEARDARVEVAVEGATVQQPLEENGEPRVAPFRRWYVEQPSSQWQLAAGEPGRLAGTWEGTVDVAIPAATYQPPLALRSRGRWAASRVSLELCPWRGRATATGAFANEQRHEETVEFTLRPLGDGRVAGEGTGRAVVSGGPPGGCEYSGGGAFVVRVVGEHRGGAFRLRLEDDEHPQLLVTVSCAGRRFVTPHAALATAFGVVEVAEAPGAAGRLDGPLPGTATRGTLELSVEPAGRLGNP